MKNIVTIRLSESELLAVHERIEDRLARESDDPIELTGTIRWEGLDDADPLVVHLIRVETKET